MWERIKAFFKRSETIFLARLNALLGAVATITSLIDPSLLQQVVTPHAFAIYMLLNGVLTEYARRRRAPDLGKDNA